MKHLTRGVVVFLLSMSVCMTVRWSWDIDLTERNIFAGISLMICFLVSIFLAFLADAAKGDE